ncbi:dentin sialophosphoprotein-like [Littorina saxatilis]|uniref:dentin sialophosphoprotein-like n=1 Tax=Littorina saxatilis TaxID=31220 RepID=UPI0038B4BC00
MLDSCGCLPCLYVGGERKKKEEKDKDAEVSSNTGPPPKGSGFCKFLICGGADVCLLSCLFCISFGKLQSDNFIWRTEVTQHDAESSSHYSASQFSSSYSSGFVNQADAESKQSQDHGSSGGSIDDEDSSVDRTSSSIELNEQSQTSPDENSYPPKMKGSGSASGSIELNEQSQTSSNESLNPPKMKEPKSNLHGFVSSDVKGSGDSQDSNDQYEPLFTVVKKDIEDK